MLFAICGRSGSGKTTLITQVLQHLPEMHQLITTTTRPRREYEKDGVDYHFKSRKVVKDMITNQNIFIPILYREEYYGIEALELEKCKSNNLICAFRPDAIPLLEEYTSVIGIYLVRELQLEIPVPINDEIILKYKHYCKHVVFNNEGNLEASAEKIINIIKQYT